MWACLFRRAGACPSPCCGLLEDRGGQAPALRTENSPVHRRARACPSPCCGLPEDRGGQAPALRAENSPVHRRARACPSPCCGLPEDRGGQAPALRTENSPFHRRARACPSPCLMFPNPVLTVFPKRNYFGFRGNRSTTRDRPSSYGERQPFRFPRRARHGEGQALALR